MGEVLLPIPKTRTTRDDYGFARMPRSSAASSAEVIDKVAYGRFRNVYLYITEACQLRCSHCYMGGRLERARKMPFDDILHTLQTWRRLGGNKLTILGGEPTLHPQYCESIRAANQIGYEYVITTTNALKPARRKLAMLEPSDFSYVQVSLDGGSASSHDLIRGEGTFAEALATTVILCDRGFDTRIICTVNKANRADALKLLDHADDIGVSLVKFHVFSTIGRGRASTDLAMAPPEWISFYKELERRAPAYSTRVWYQPTFATRADVSRYSLEGYQGCIGRTLDRISIFPDGRCYVCSYLFDTNMHFAEMRGRQINVNPRDNEFSLFTSALAHESCESCKEPASCCGGCPAEKVVTGTATCVEYEDIVAVCRLWKSSAKHED